MRRICTILAVLAATYATPAWSDDASTAAVHQLLSEMNYPQLYQETLTAATSQLPTMLTTQLRQQFESTGLNAAQRKLLDDELPAIVQRLVDRIMQMMQQAVPYSEMETVLVGAMSRTFTAEEIQDLIAFYRTPTGKKMLAKTPSLTQEAMQALMPKLQSALQGGVPGIDKEFEALTAKLKAAK